MGSPCNLCIVSWDYKHEFEWVSELNSWNWRAVGGSWKISAARQPYSEDWLEKMFHAGMRNTSAFTQSFDYQLVACRKTKLSNVWAMKKKRRFRARHDNAITFVTLRVSFFMTKEVFWNKIDDKWNQDLNWETDKPCSQHIDCHWLYGEMEYTI